MKRLISLALVFLLALPALGAFTEFYVQPTGNNVNAGSTTADAALFTFTSGNWANGTGVFTASGADLSAVTAGMWASVYTNADTRTHFVGRITAVDDGADTITVSTTIKSGTNPGDGTGDRSIKVGGAWAGPATTVGFPFGFVQVTMTNTSADVLRVNFKTNTYGITAAMTHANAGPMWFQGYATSAGDGGRAIIDGGTAGASYTMLNINDNRIMMADFTFQNNGATGAADGINNIGNGCVIWRCLFRSLRRCGYRSTANVTAIECEAYDCNEANSAGFAAFSFASSGSSIVRCIAHNNTNGANGNGFVLDTSLNLLHCVSANNGGHGAVSNGDVNQNFYHCDFYNNTGSGFNFSGGSQVVQSTFQNCNFLKNGAYGIQWRTIGHIGLLLNCGFGTGTQTNATNFSTVVPYGILEVGTVNYAAGVTPWQDPVNGDFRISLAAAKGAGRGFFLQLAPSYTNTVGYPDIGASPATNAASGGGGSYLFAQ